MDSSLQGRFIVRDTLKTYKRVWDQFCSFENLELAYEKARKHKTANPSVKKFDEHWRLQFCILLRELRNQRYRPKLMKTFVLKDPKTRVISISDFRDRIVHHAVVNILQPIFEPRFIYDSYASIKGKGTLAALKRFDCFKQKITKNGTLECFILKADIKQYFQTVDHEILVSILRKKVMDEKFLSVIECILHHYQTNIPKKGMPLGNWTSQFFANVYLNELDQFVKHHLKAKYYLRYVDDFVILDASQEKLEEYRQKISVFLITLKLELHQNKTQIVPLRRGVGFLGYRVFYHYKLLRKKNRWKIQNTLTNHIEEFRNSEEDAWKILERFRSWEVYAMHGNTYTFRQQLRKLIEKELQMTKV